MMPDDNLTCNNVISGGSIVGNETLCTPDIDPSIIQSSSLPAGGTGTIEYLWLSTTIFSNDLNSWNIIPGATGPSYDPPAIFQTTHFIRCARRSGCNEFVGETNIVTKEYRTGIFLDLQVTNPVGCTGNNGALNLTVFGESLGLHYEWSNGLSFIEDPDNLPAGIYSVTVTNYLGCSASESIALEAPGGLSCGANITSDFGGLAVSGFNANDGSISVFANGQNGPFSYLWSNGQTGTTAYNLSPGFYQITVTDGSGCNCVANALLENPAKVEGRLWHDRNGNGLQDAGEGGMPFLSVALNGLTEDGNVVSRNLFTDGNGFYRFDGLPAGSYSCTYSLPETYVFTIPNNGDELSDSDVQNGQSELLQLDFGTCVSSLDAGMYRPLNIGDFVWEDYNANGIQDFGEPGIPDLTVQLFNPGTDGIANTNDDILIAALQTNSSGHYLFETVSPGNYFLAFEQPQGYEFTLLENTTNNYLDSNVDPLTGQTPVFTLISLEPDDPSLDAGLFTCRPDNDGGTIGPDQFFCPGAMNETIIYNNTLPSGGFGELSFSWYRSSEAIPFDINNPAWALIPDATQSDYTPELIAQNTFFVRCAIRNNCTTPLSSNIVTYEIIEPPVVLLEAVGEPDCFGGNDGYILLSNDAPQVNFSWSNGQQGASIQNLAAGTYSVTATNAFQCTAEAEFSIAQPALLQLDAVTTDLLCAGQNDGSISLLPSGGTPPYFYQWSNGMTTESAENLAAGNYVITLLDNSNCEASIFTTINAPQPLSAGFQQSPVSCFNGTDGSLTALPSGGTPPYTFSWSNGTTENTLSNQPAGNYEVTITDNNGCSFSGSQTINSVTEILLNVSLMDVDCFGGNDGTALIEVSGGSPGYTLLWSNGGAGYFNGNLAAGNYTVTVTDANNCPSVIDFEIVQPEAIVADFEVVQIACSNGNDGSIAAIPSGGNPPYNFQWNNGQTSNTIQNIQSGNYTVTISDYYSCTFVETVSVLNGSSVDVVINSVNPGCSGEDTGSISSTVSGGEPPYNYHWNNGASEMDLQNLTSGFYALTVTDANGCFGFASTMLEESTPLALELQQTPLTCFEGNDATISTNFSGGTPPYNFAWSNNETTQNISGLTSGEYIVTVSDANACSAIASIEIAEAEFIFLQFTDSNVSCALDETGTASVNPLTGNPPFTFAWSNGENTPEITGLAAGNYAVTVTDNLGCTVVGYVDIQGNSEIMVDLVANDTECAGNASGSASVVASGGEPPYAFAWSNGASGNYVGQLPAGIYSLSVTDANGCLAVQDFTINDVDAIDINISTTPVSCNNGNDGTASAEVSGGQAPYTFAWSHGATSSTATGLAAGDYSLTVTDALFCNTVITFVVNENVNINAMVETTPPNCFGLDDGSINVLVSGGEAPFVFNWSNGATTAAINNLPEGNYSLTITDNNNCTFVETVELIAPAALNLEVETNPVSCSGGADGSAEAIITGGTAPYEILWSNGSDEIYNNNFTAGAQFVQLSDANGCSASIAFNIAEPAALSVEINRVLSDCDDNLYNLSADVSGGIPAYQYEWSNGSTSPNINDIGPGAYSVTITDANDCTQSASIEFALQAPIELFVETESPACNGATDGFANVEISGGTAPFNIFWSTGASGTSASNLATGEYSVSIQDALGCTGAMTFSITEPATLELYANVLVSGCNNGGLGIAEAVCSGGVPPYYYQWSDGQNTAVAQNLIPGVHNVTITDQNDCAISGAVELEDGLQISIAANTSDVICEGYTTGSIIGLVDAGVPPLSYEWNTGDTTSSIFSLVEGVYSLTVTDGNACTGFASIIIDDPTPFELDLFTTGLNCYNSTDGSITAIPSQGVGPYTYNWNTGATTATIENIGLGFYVVTVTDANGCPVISGEAIGNVVPVQLSLSSLPATCNGLSDGSLGSSVFGGTPPYAYSWNTSDTTPEVHDVSAGTYYLTVTDNNGCTDTASIAIMQPDILQAGVVFEPLSCAFGQDAGATVNIWGGTMPYEIVWNDPANQSTMTAENLAAGQYSVSVTDLNGCTTSASIEIPELIPIDVLMLEHDVLCHDGTNGGATAITWGGAKPYTFLWDDAAQSTDSILTNVAPGIYHLTITDQKGCTHTEAAVVGEPSMLTASFEITATNCYNSSDGSITINSSGGSYGHNYQWDDPSFGNGMTIINLTSGDYTVTVTDGHGCTLVETIHVPETEPINAVFDVPESMCLDEAGYFAAANADSYFWEFGADANPQTSGEAVVGDVVWSTPGNKTVKLTLMENTCTVVEYFSLEVEDCTDPFVDSLKLDLRQKADGAIELLWKFTEGAEKATYVVEVSGNNQPFKHLHTMEARDAGLQFYFQEDAEPVPGWNYYRLTRLSPDGEILETIEKIFVESDAGRYLLFPNPAEDKIFLTSLDALTESTTFSLHGASGKNLPDRIFKQDNHQLKINLDNLPEGLYFLVQKNTEGDVVGVYKIVKI